jgi:predicted DNA-binding transcriptional regulator AlpA
MTKPRDAAGPAQGLHPRQIVRKTEGPRYFGLGRSQIDEAIKSGKIPRPFPLVDGGKAQGWTGQQILDHQAKRIAATDKQINPKS